MRYKIFTILIVIFNISVMCGNPLNDMSLQLQTIVEAINKTHDDIKIAQEKLSRLEESEVSCEPCCMWREMHGMQARCATEGLMHTCSLLEITIAKKYLDHLQAHARGLKARYEKTLRELFDQYGQELGTGSFSRDHRQETL